MNSIFEYNDNPISFRNENGILFVNATEMAKPFRVRPADWLRTENAHNYIAALLNVKKCTFDDLVIVKEGSPLTGGGTWMHEDVALEFSRWLSPEFAIWCNAKIKELLQQGYTKLESISRKDLALMLLEAEEAREQLMAENERKSKQLRESMPKVLFADAVTASGDSILIRELAIILRQRGINIGQNRLFEWLRENEYLCKKGESYNQPSQRSMDLGLFEIKKTTVQQPNGTVIISETPKVTPKGQIYFISKFLVA